MILLHSDTHCHDQCEDNKLTMLKATIYVCFTEVQSCATWKSL